MSEPLHRRVLEPNATLFAVVSTVAVSIGGLVEIVPLYSAALGPERMDEVEPYTPLEVAGRDIYVREGCYNCHSQMIRPMLAETMRYGPWTRAGEYQWDHPFQLGSRRIGPDLQRVGGKYPDAWHYQHMENPRATSPGSVMPVYPWLIDDAYDVADVTASVVTLTTLGVPYPPAAESWVGANVAEQAASIVGRLAETKIDVDADREIVALIAYLQSLGVDGKKAIGARGGVQ